MLPYQPNTVFDTVFDEKALFTRSITLLVFLNTGNYVSQTENNSTMSSSNEIHEKLKESFYECESSSFIFSLFRTHIWFVSQENADKKLVINFISSSRETNMDRLHRQFSFECRFTGSSAIENVKIYPIRLRISEETFIVEKLKEFRLKDRSNVRRVSMKNPTVDEKSADKDLAFWNWFFRWMFDDDSSVSNEQSLW